MKKEYGNFLTDDFLGAVDLAIYIEMKKRGINRLSTLFAEKIASEVETSITDFHYDKRKELMFLSDYVVVVVDEKSPELSSRIAYEHDDFAGTILKYSNYFIESGLDVFLHKSIGDFDGKKIILVQEKHVPLHYCGCAINKIKEFGGETVALITECDMQERINGTQITHSKQFEMESEVPIFSLFNLTYLIDMLKNTPAESGDDEVGECLNVLEKCQEQISVMGKRGIKYNI